MSPAVFLIVIVMVAVCIGSLILIGWSFGKSSDDQAQFQKFQADLVKHLPPDVQANMKPRPVRPLIALFVVIIALPLMVFGMISAGKGRDAILMGCGLLSVAAITPLAVATLVGWLRRTKRGQTLVDLSPFPMADALRRSSWRQLLVFGLIFPSTLMSPGPARFWYAAAVALFLLFLLLSILTYSDRVAISERGLDFGGQLFPWSGFDRVAWTDDDRAFALRRKSRWALPRWLLVPVPAESRAPAKEALRTVMPTPAADVTA